MHLCPSCQQCPPAGLWSSLPLRVGGSPHWACPTICSALLPARPLGLGVGPLLCPSVLAFPASHAQCLLEFTSQVSPASMAPASLCPRAPQTVASPPSAVPFLPSPTHMPGSLWPGSSRLRPSSWGTSTWVKVMSVVIALGQAIGGVCSDSAGKPGPWGFQQGGLRREGSGVAKWT